MAIGYSLNVQRIPEGVLRERTGRSSAEPSRADAGRSVAGKTVRGARRSGDAGLALPLCRPVVTTEQVIRWA